MIFNFGKILRSIIKLLSDKNDLKTYNQIEFKTKHYPRDSEELKKLKIQNI
jgi:hypothetical protein